MSRDEADPPAPRTLAGITARFGATRATVARLVDAGLLAPTRGPRGEWRFSFRDALLIRTAQGLRAAGIPPRRLADSLRRVRDALPPGTPLTSLRIAVIGDAVVVRDGLSPWEAGTGQRTLEFQVEPAGARVVVLPGRADDPLPPPDDAQAWFDRGRQLEADDALGAEAAWRHALALDPAHEDANVDLGALLCEQGRCAEAAALYDAAVARRPDAPALWFNRALALEDLGRDDDAVASYERCLRLAPGETDAHYNLSRLHERHGRAQAALRHLNAYRRGGR